VKESQEIDAREPRPNERKRSERKKERRKQAGKQIKCPLRICLRNHQNSGGKVISKGVPSSLSLPLPLLLSPFTPPLSHLTSPHPASPTPTPTLERKKPYQRVLDPRARKGKERKAGSVESREREREREREEGRDEKWTGFRSVEKPLEHLRAGRVRKNPCGEARIFRARRVFGRGCGPGEGWVEREREKEEGERERERGEVQREGSRLIEETYDRVY